MTRCPLRWIFTILCSLILTTAAIRFPLPNMLGFGRGNNHGGNTMSCRVNDALVTSKEEQEENSAGSKRSKNPITVLATVVASSSSTDITTNASNTSQLMDVTAAATTLAPPLASKAGASSLSGGATDQLTYLQTMAAGALSRYVDTLDCNYPDYTSLTTVSLCLEQVHGPDIDASCQHVQNHATAERRHPIQSNVQVDARATAAWRRCPVSAVDAPRGTVFLRHRPGQVAPVDLLVRVQVQLSAGLRRQHHQYRVLLHRQHPADGMIDRLLLVPPLSLLIIPYHN